MPTELMRTELERAQQELEHALDALTVTTLLPTSPLGADPSDRIAGLIKSVGEKYSPGVTQRLLDEYFGAGPLETAIACEDITEILINRFDSIWIERGGKLLSWPEKFLSAATYESFCERMRRESRVLVGMDNPFGDGTWQSFRIHCVTAPVSQTGSVTSLRRKAKQAWSLDALADAGWARPEQILALKELVARRENFLIVGGTGSGKTSVLNACLGEIGAEERAVIIEDTNELDAPNKVSLKLLTRHDANGILREVRQSDLVKQSLRMRPDRIVMGEIRGEEAKDLLMAFATGHRGCLGTMHADSARQALLRLEMLIQLGAAQWSVSAVRQLIYLSLKAIVVITKMPCGRRQLEGIYRVVALEEIGFLLERVT